MAFFLPAPALDAGRFVLAADVSIPPGVVTLVTPWVAQYDFTSALSGVDPSKVIIKNAGLKHVFLNTIWQPDFNGDFRYATRIFLGGLGVAGQSIDVDVFPSYRIAFYAGIPINEGGINDFNYKFAANDIIQVGAYHESSGHNLLLKAGTAFGFSTMEGQNPGSITPVDTSNPLHCQIPGFAFRQEERAPARVVNGIGVNQYTFSASNVISGYAFSAADPITFTAYAPGVYRFRQYVVLNWDINDEGILGCGFTKNGTTLAELIAFARKGHHSQPAPQHCGVYCCTEDYLSVGDSISYVGLLSSLINALPSGETSGASMEWVV